MVKTRTVLLGATAFLALGFIAAPVDFNSQGFGVDTAAAAGKGGGHDDDCDTSRDGNPGNTKQVGGAGERPPKGEGEGFFSPEEGGPGERGRSDRP